MKTTIESLKALNPKLEELVLVKYKGFEKSLLGQVASGGSVYNQSIFDEVNNRVYVHFKPQSFPTALEIDKIESFLPISKIKMTVIRNSNGSLAYTTQD